MSAKTSSSTSPSLLQRAVESDEEAWQQLVHLYGPLVHRWCKRSGLSDEDTSDVFQETFRAVSSGIASFKPQRDKGSFRSWLRTIVRTKTVDHFRRQNRQPRAQGGTEAQMQIAEHADHLGADSLDDAGHDAGDDDAIVVQRAIELIRPEFSEQNWNAFQQVALHGRSATEVAGELGVAPQTIRQANYRIRRRLRLVLQDLVE